MSENEQNSLCAALASLLLARLQDPARKVTRRDSWPMAHESKSSCTWKFVDLWHSLRETMLFWMDSQRRIVKRRRSTRVSKHSATISPPIDLVALHCACPAQTGMHGRSSSSKSDRLVGDRRDWLGVAQGPLWRFWHRPDQIAWPLPDGRRSMQWRWRPGFEASQMMNAQSQI